MIFIHFALAEKMLLYLSLCLAGSFIAIKIFPSFVFIFEYMYKLYYLYRTKEESSINFDQNYINIM